MARVCLKELRLRIDGAKDRQVCKYLFFDKTNV